MSGTEGLSIDYKLLQDDVLRGVIEAFVMQEGTDYGLSEFSLESKVKTVLKQLQSGKAELVFDPETQSCNIRGVLC